MTSDARQVAEDAMVRNLAQFCDACPDCGDCIAAKEITAMRCVKVIREINRIENNNA